MRKWKGWWIPTPVTGKEKDSWGCYATKQTEKCSEIQCRDCIYWNLDGQAEWRLKEYLKEHKQGKEQVRDSKGRFCKKEETESYDWEGLKVPVDPKREWGEWMCSEVTCPGVSGGVGCGHACSCVDCIYARRHWEERRCFYEQWYGKHPTSVKNELPKLTAEIFKRSDCPEWAKWAAVDASGKARFFSRKPLVECRFCSWYTPWCREEEDIQLIEGTKFDPTNWEHSLIERPQKELPKLTKTAFHCPDCPKEAAKLKVFPANHVVALDKDDKVLSVMELQCKEGEVKKPEEGWHYGWYFIPGKGPTYSKTGWLILPKKAYSIKVQYLPEKELVGKAVTSTGWKDDYLVKEVRYHSEERITVMLIDVKGQIFPVLMEDFIQYYRFAGTGDFCCTYFKTE